MSAVQVRSLVLEQACLILKNHETRREISTDRQMGAAWVINSANRRRA